MREGGCRCREEEPYAVHMPYWRSLRRKPLIEKCDRRKYNLGMIAPLLPPQFDETITGWLMQWKEGDLAALECITVAVYQDLRRLAAFYLKSETKANRLQPAALVHEAYLKMVPMRGFDCEGRAHFISFAARTMRRILVDHSRLRSAAKRTVEAAPFEKVAAGLRVDLLAVNQALDRLAEEYPRKARVVELHFFGGLAFPEIAHSLDVSLATVERDWRFARAWLQKRLNA